ncbi:hypothetical protein SSABA_v1c01030 [Spiroplasma sabaudiense Ar-1343]|uniref:Lipoprotein n=1 Tax=Spiroplasma sabaudiense Ar-1343 TaxID=1276257 RepID=W6A9F4_9MOLU|nr:hypothetical protein [Spiroplasma sabaudiense]AHI53515.1 hypothetical protein SSABA_v1c01030 [Spiroplasma sabaudiense Ar-1343]
MKKILSFLGTTSIVVSAPLSAVACRSIDKIKEEFDFELLKNQMMETINTIFQEYLSSDFENFYFIEEGTKAPLEKYLVADLIANKEEIESKGSAFFELSESIKGIINWQKILKEVNQEVVTNVQYRQLLIDGQNPLKNGYEISEITIEPKANDTAVTINLKIQADVWFLDKIQEQAFETIYFTNQISIFEESQDVEKLTSIQKKYKAEINSSEIANSFFYNSDHGDLEETARNISSDKEIKNQIINIVEEIIEDENLVINKDFLIKPSANDSLQSASPVTDEPNLDDLIDLMIDAMKSGSKEDFEDVASKILISENELYFEFYDTIGIDPPKDSKTSNLINPYYLDFKYNSTLDSLFKMALVIQGNKFKIDPENDDINTIAIFKTEISKIKLEYKNSSFELP